MAAVRTPDDARALPDSGRLGEIVVRPDGTVLLTIAVTAPEAPAWEPVRLAAEQAVRALPGVATVLATLTAERAPARAPAQPSPPKPAQAGPPVHPNLADVRRIVAVASGKGGVGKSTLACNLALALALDQPGLRVGLLDADVYGPSLPKLLALAGRPTIIDGRTIAPLDAYGLKAMSIGLMVDADKGLAWRGPMVAAAITQMLRDVAWGPLDVLIVDMPPGTGDAQLTLAQQARLTGAVIVSTPQDLALIDARRGVAMFREVGVPILGLVENMSVFVCDQCGKHHHIFAHGGARAEAARLSLPFLGEVPLALDIRERSDAGLPVVVTAPDSPGAQAYRAIAAALWSGLAGRS